MLIVWTPQLKGRCQVGLKKKSKPLQKALKFRDTNRLKVKELNKRYHANNRENIVATVK